jgi:hypothetical protein
MTIEQTIEIPASRRVFLDLPQDLPVGRAKITVTPETVTSDECLICAKHRDSETGELRFNVETHAGIQEVEDMITGKTPTKWYNSLNEMMTDLDA